MAKQGLRGIEAALTIPKDKKPSTKPKKEEFKAWSPWDKEDGSRVFPNGKYLWDDVYNKAYEVVLNQYDDNYHNDNCDQTYFSIINDDTDKEVAMWSLGRVGLKPAVKLAKGKGKGKIIYIDMSYEEEYYKENPDHLPDDFLTENYTDNATRKD